MHSDCLCMNTRQSNELYGIVSIYVYFGLPNPMFSVREIIRLCMGESEYPIRGYGLIKSYGHVCVIVVLQMRSRTRFQNG